MKYGKYFLLTLGVILADQIIKLLAYYHMYLPIGDVGYEKSILGDWLKLHFTLNEGMAFGLKIAGEYGKLFLSLFRIIAVGAIGYYLYYLAKKEVPAGLLWSIALILGGAIGNVVDSTFYGVFLNLAPANAPTPWFHGMVIDMFYIDICNCYIPEWVPIFGDTYYPLWPIFNLADSAIFVGVALILINQKKFFKEKKGEGKTSETEVDKT